MPLRGACDADGFRMQRLVERLAHPRATRLRMDELDVVAVVFRGKVHDAVNSSVNNFAVGKYRIESDEHSRLAAVAQEIERAAPRSGDSRERIVRFLVDGVNGRHYARHLQFREAANLLLRRAVSRRIDPHLKSRDFRENRLKAFKAKKRFAAFDSPRDNAEVAHLADVLNERRQWHFVRVVLTLVAVRALVRTRLRNRENDADGARRTADDFIL